MGLFGDKEKEKELEREKAKYEALSLKLFFLKFKLVIVAIIVVIFSAIVLVWKITENMKGSALEDVENAVMDAIVGEEGEVTTITKTSLEKVFEISEFSTADYTYNAIAYAYKEDDITARYYVAYKGTVKAGMDFSKIQFEIDEVNKKIVLDLPECEIQSTTVDFGSMEYIFADKKYETETVSQEAYKLCQEDLAKRSAQEEELLYLARENAIAVVEALVYPWVNQLDAQYIVEIK